NWQMAEGAWFNKSDQMGGLPVALLGKTVMHNLFDASGVDTIARMIHIRDQIFRVAGVLQAKGSVGASDQDDVIFVPFTTALTRLKNSTYVDQIQVQVDSASNVDQVQQQVITILEQRHHIINGAPDDFRTTSSNQL